MRCPGPKPTASRQWLSAKPNRYVIVPGHATIEGENVVEDNGHFHVVEKEHDGSE